jgi:hypothetical protein
VLTNNRRVLNGPAGGINQKHLRFEMTPDNDGFNSGSRQTVTFTFSNPVSNVAFSFFPATSNAGNLNIRYAGPITSFSFVYRNEAEEGGSNQLISLSDLTFTC